MMFNLKCLTIVIMAFSAMAIPYAANAYQENTEVVGVDLKGRVTYSGEIPEPKILEVNRDSEYCGETMPDESVIVDPESRGIVHVIVNLKEITAGKPFPQKTSVSINNQNCRFHPSVNVGRTGSTLEIMSSDPVLHNTHILQNDDTFLNVALPPGGRTIRKTLAQSGRLKVRCDAHLFMQASIHIFDHPYFTNTDETGQFTLTKVPPGTHVLQLWHQIFGMKELVVTVTKSGPVIVNVSFP